MTEFKVGDTVRVVSEWVRYEDYSPLNGREGVLKGILPIEDDHTYPFYVEFPDDMQDSDYVHAIELVMDRDDVITKSELTEWLRQRVANLSSFSGERAIGRNGMITDFAERFGIDLTEPKPIIKKVRVSFEIEFEAGSIEEANYEAAKKNENPTWLSMPMNNRLFEVM